MDDLLDRKKYFRRPLYINITNIMRKYNIGILPTFDLAREFSVEKFYHPYPFGGHSFWFCKFDFISLVKY